MNTDFPEYLFPCDNTLYKYKVEQGENICKNKSIIFCSIVRDAESVLNRNIQCLHRTGSLFKDYEIFIYENDSIDNTVEILRQNKSNKLNYISETRQDKDYVAKIISGEDRWHFNRCNILAECRNKYLTYINNLEKKFDYICVVDLDVCGGWSYIGIAHGIFTLESNDLYAAVTSYGVLAEHSGKINLESIPNKNYLMYDTLAFRPKNWKSGIHMNSLYVFNNIHLSRGQDPFEVQSNFGGMAIYKKNHLLNKQYKAKQWQEGFTDPDHVMLNKEIIDSGYKILLDPSMIVSYSHHTNSMFHDSKIQIIGEKCLT
jgi:hypothetical protein